MQIKLGENLYELVEEYKDGFDKEVLEEKYTSYFEDYDYILGDWAYGKLRLKGFCEKGNKLFKKINDYSSIKEYIKESCAYDCKYFIIKKRTR
jgi:uncharacterized protein YutD